MFRSFCSVILFECYTQAIDEVICRSCLPLTMDVVVLSASGITAPSIQSEEIHITACAHIHIHCASSQMVHDAELIPVSVAISD